MMTEKTDTIFGPILSRIVGGFFIAVAITGAAAAAILYFGWPF